jgi:TetR/AcrR family transcriptional regulator, regulator of cefoperazone and chloramphenicol sensitivity
MPSLVMPYRKPRSMTADEPRTRLIEAGLDLFGKYSFDGASTRMLADRAQVNLASIKYYYGGKEGLYLAVAEHIVEQIDKLLGPRLAKVQEALEKEPVSKEESFRLLCELQGFLITSFLGLPQTDKWLSIIVREQLCPTEAFSILFEGFMRPLENALFGLATRIMSSGRDNQEVKLRVFAIIGEIQVFHILPSTIKRTLNWESYGPENLDAIRRVTTDNLRKIFSMSPDCPYATSDIVCKNRETDRDLA